MVRRAINPVLLLSLAGCTSLQGVDVRQAALLPNMGNQIQSVSVTEVEGRYFTKTTTLLNCHPACEAKAFEALSFESWANLTGQAPIIELLAEQELARSLTPDIVRQQNLGRLASVFALELNDLLPVVPIDKFRVYLVKDDERLAMQWRAWSDSAVTPVFAFPVRSNVALEAKVAAALADIPDPLSEEFAVRLRRMGREAELVDLMSTLAHESTHVFQHITPAWQREPGSWSSCDGVNSEVMAELVGLYMKARLYRELNGKPMVPEDINFTFALPPIEFPTEQVRAALQRGTSDNDDLLRQPLQKYLAAGNLAACLGIDKLRNDVTSLQTVKQLIVRALQNMHDFTQGYLLPADICK